MPKQVREYDEKEVNEKSCKNLENIVDIAIETHMRYLGLLNKQPI